MVRRARSHFVALAYLVVASAGFAGFQARPASPPTSPPVAGTWNSEFGVVTLVQSDGEITGFMARAERRIAEFTSGSVEGDRLVLRYRWGDMPGTAIFSYSAFEPRWEGNYRHESGALGGWNLTPVVPAQQPPPAAPRRPQIPSIPIAPPAPPARSAAPPSAPAPLPKPRPTPGPQASTPGTGGRLGATTTPDLIDVAPPPQGRADAGARAPDIPDLSPLPPVRTPLAVEKSSEPAVLPQPPVLPLADVPPSPPSEAIRTFGPLSFAVPVGWTIESESATAVLLRTFTNDRLASIVIQTLGPAAGPLDTYVANLRAQVEGGDTANVRFRSLDNRQVAGVMAVQMEIQVGAEAVAVRSRQLVLDLAGTRYTVALNADATVFDANLAAFEALVAAIR